MTAFETVGMKHQFNAKDIYDAKLTLQFDCQYCRSTKQNIKCSNCYIKDTYKLMCKYFQNKKGTKKL